MKALIEPIAAVLRVVHEGGDHGDTYSFAATVRWLDRHTVELCGAMRAPTFAEARALINSLREGGVRTILLRRYRKGRQHLTHLKLGRHDD